MGDGSVSNTIRRKASSFEEHSLMSKAWEHRGLSLRAADSLVDNGILTLDDLHRAHELELATVPGVGRKSLAVLYGLMRVVNCRAMTEGDRAARRADVWPADLAATCQTRRRSTGCLAHRDGRAFLVTSTARAQIDFAQAIATVIAAKWGKPLVAVPSQRALRPRTDAPTNGLAH